MPALYALDTNVYVDALRDGAALARLKRFLLRTGQRIRLNAVVVLELRAGARRRAQERAVEALVSPHVTRDRVVVPSFESYAQAGRVIALLATRERTTPAASLANDVLLASSCRGAGVTLVTGNHRDFAAIQRHLQGFRFEAADDVIR